MIFVDFEKAFDSVDRWMALRRRRIPNKIVSVIKSTYNDAKCRVLHNGTLAEPFVVGSGVRQVCICAVFSSHWKHYSSLAKHHSVSKYSGIRWKMDSFLQHLDYADDICLQSHSVLDTANMLYSLENEAASFGLKINKN